VTMIIEAGVDKNHKNKDGENAFWIACKREASPEAFKALLDGEVDHLCVAGSDVISEIVDREVPKLDEILTLFIEKDFPADTIKDEKAKAKFAQVQASIKEKKEAKASKKKAKKQFDFEKLKELTKCDEQKFDYDFWQDDVKKIHEGEGNVSLLQAYIDNSEDGLSLDAIKMIIKAGVDVNHRDRDDCNALWIATKRTNDINIYKALFAAGCSGDYMPENEGDLCTAYVNNSKSHDREVDTEIVKMIMYKGLDLQNIEDDEVMELAMPFALEKSDMKPEDLKKWEESLGGAEKDDAKADGEGSDSNGSTKEDEDEEESPEEKAKKE